ncbi:dehydrodolichyl diphosphate synthase complex subunit nus1 isoform X2 [Anabrus simplex]|uniref:dehydrodolichyl diphosphate synthase complex subunit nus1 isoform X2 n=1 Tax=Anabrus simplex TaxID=316456 RepID=UPI0034DCF9D6
MVFNIYSFLRTLLSFVYCVVTFIARVWKSFRKNYLELLYKSNYVKNELEFISRESRLLRKTPCHVVVILGNESISFKDLANLTIWCIAARIPFISFYDHSGLLKKKQTELLRILADVNKGYTENIIWGKKSLTNGMTNKNGTKNGIAPQRIHVNIYSHADGKGSIVDVTNNLCQSALAGEFSSNQVTQDLLDKMLQAELGVPDPELGICCGPSFCTFGVLPWQIRVTEFLNGSV